MYNPNTPYKEGVYTPINKSKYIGKSLPKFKSSWEERVCYYLDVNENVIRWSYEKFVIPYLNKIDNRVHRYFVDFYAEVKQVDGSVRKFLVEVKPEVELSAPKPPKRKTAKSEKRYLTEKYTFVVNSCKWEAADKYCRERGWEFTILTEKDIFNNRFK